MLNREAEDAARLFNAGRARQTIVRLWEQTRWMDTPAVFRVAEVAVGCLRDAGVEDVRIEHVPSDGKQSVAGWLMPVAWSVREARLETAQRRQIMFFFSTEVRGILWWLNQQKHVPAFLGGINLDMVSADPVRESARMMIRKGFRHRPHFSAHVLFDAAKLADRRAPGMISGTDIHPLGFFFLENVRRRS